MSEPSFEYWPVALKFARQHAGLTQAEVARRMGRSRSSVSALERGKTDPYLSVLQRYVRALGGTLTTTVEPLPTPACPTCSGRAIVYDLDAETWRPCPDCEEET